MKLLGAFAPLLLLPLLARVSDAQPPQGQPRSKQRVIVLTDIEADPDDSQSLVRLLLYSNLLDIQGIVATTSTHQRDRIAPDSIERIINAYGQVRENLARNAAGFPSARSLVRLIKRGAPVYGMLGVGEGQDTEGSNWILRKLATPDKRPLWISVWGGANTLAQALHTLQRTQGTGGAKELVSRLRVYSISDQDDSAAWIRRNFPELFYIVSPGGYGSSTWSAINQRVVGIDNRTISNGWLAKNIQQNHGALGATYPDVAYGMEGDTPAFLSLIPNGLNSPEHPDWGGWGGRYELRQPSVSELDTDGFTGGVSVEAETRPIWTNASDKYSPIVPNAYGRSVRRQARPFEDNKTTLWRWRDDFQNDFAARMDWTVEAFANANHPPVPALAHSPTLTVGAGQSFFLDANGTTDPDGDSLSYLWFHYPEPGTLVREIPIHSAENLARVHIVAPAVARPESAHFILKVTDKGEPPLSRYKRVIVTILPSAQNGTGPGSKPTSSAAP